MKVNPFNLTKLTGASHLQLMTDVNTMLTDAKVPADKAFGTLYTVFIAALTAEGESQKTELGSQFAKQLEDADLLRDNRYRGLALTVEANLYHKTTTLVDSARRVMRVIDQFGNPTNKPLNDETSILSSIVAELETTYVADVTALGLTTWVAALKEANTNFATLTASRNTEQAARTALPMKDCRKVLDAAYKHLVERLNALVNINGTATYGSLVDKLNERLDYFRNLVAVKEGRASKTDDKAKPEAAK